MNIKELNKVTSKAMAVIWGAVFSITIISTSALFHLTKNPNPENNQVQQEQNQTNIFVNKGAIATTFKDSNKVVLQIDSKEAASHIESILQRYVDNSDIYYDLVRGDIKNFEEGKPIKLTIEVLDFFHPDEVAEALLNFEAEVEPIEFKTRHREPEPQPWKPGMPCFVLDGYNATELTFKHNCEEDEKFRW